MVRGGGKRCWEIHPLTSNAHSVILSLYFCGFMSEWGKAESERERERIANICGSACWVAAATACALRTNFTTYLHILKPSCNIASYSSADVCCCSHQFSASLSFICNLFVWLTFSYSGHFSWATSCPCVTECILCYFLYYLHHLGDSHLYQKCCRTSLQAQGFYTSSRCKTTH